MKQKKKKNYCFAQEVCNMVGISKKTLFLWENQGLISKPPRDWRGWRMYEEKHLKEVKKVIERKKKKKRLV